MDRDPRRGTRALMRTRIGVPVFLLCVASLLAPSIALADDCSAWTLGEVPSCLLLGALLPPFLVAAAILAAASWLGSHTSPAQPTKRTAPPSPALTENKDNVEAQNRAYDPGGTNMGGSGI
jgi:hypothetical protein